MKFSITIIEEHFYVKPDDLDINDEIIIIFYLPKKFSEERSRKFIMDNKIDNKE